MSNLLNVLLMAQPAGGKGSIMDFLPLLLIIVVFYFFMIRPQMKRQKDLRKYRESLDKGDKVITTGGVYGKIADVKDDVVILEVADNVRLRVAKSAVVRDTTDIPAAK